jgi:vancomycin resistance protein YoaR
MSFVTVPRPRRSPIPLQILAVLIGSLLFFLLAIALVSGGYEMLYAGRVFPGISMAGADLTSMTPEQAMAAVNQRLTYPTSGKIVFRYGEKVWVATPYELGMVFDVGTSIQRAYNVGRQGELLTKLASQLNAWQAGLDLKPVIVFNEQFAYAYLQDLARQIDQPVVETDLHLDGTEVVYTRGQTGRLLDVDATLASLLSQLSTFQDGEVQLVVEEQSPLIQDASAQAESLRKILSAPLTLDISNPQPGDPGPWAIEPADLATMLSVNPVKTDSGWQYQVSVANNAIEQIVAPIAPLVNQSPENARFYFDDASNQLVLVKSATTGRTLDVTATSQMANQKLLQGEHTISLVITVAQPLVPDNATAAELGITGLVPHGSYTSYFRGSSAARLQNIQAAASRFYGLLIPPNTTFSMGEAIGDINLNNGYAEALIIYNGKTITGVGGGVCQVSTTLFRTAFFAGYPIPERHAHAYRVYYYEQTAKSTDPSMAGLDATVYFPLVNLKFTNDRPYWLLMETYFNAKDYSLTWKFYSGDDGRTVNWQNLGLRNVVPAPDPLFEENPDLGPGEIKQVDWPGDGTDITVTRIVSLGGQTLFTDAIQTHYEPWQAVCQYGPGTDNPQALAAQLGLCQH